MAELSAIFFAGAGFDAAGYVDGVGADVEDGFGDVFGGEAAGKDDAVGFGGAAGDLPIGALARAAVLAGFCGVEKKGADRRLEGAEACQAKIFPNAESSRDFEKFRGGAGGGGWFVAVELDSVEIDRAGQSDDGFGGPVYEDAGGFDFFGEGANDFVGVGGRDVADAFFVKIEAEGVGAEIDGEFGVGEIGDAADFYAHAGHFNFARVRGLRSCRGDLLEPLRGRARTSEIPR